MNINVSSILQGILVIVTEYVIIVDGLAGGENGKMYEFGFFVQPNAVIIPLCLIVCLVLLSVHIQISLSSLLSLGKQNGSVGFVMDLLVDI